MSEKECKINKYGLKEIILWFDNYIKERAEDPENPSTIEEINMLDLAYDCLKNYCSLKESEEIMEQKIESLILDIQDEAEKLCEYKDDSYQYILGLIEQSKIPKEMQENCKTILNNEPSLFKAYTDVVIYLSKDEEE